MAALVQTVTEGGRARSRRRALALAGAGLVLAGGAAAGVIAVARDDGGAGVAAPRWAAIADAGLHSAIPIQAAEGSVVGAVLVSRSTARILTALYEVRLGIFQVFLASLGVAVLLSVLLSGTIARPLQKLRNQAAALLDHRGLTVGHVVHVVAVRPEVGDDHLAHGQRALPDPAQERVHDAAGRGGGGGANA